MPQAEDSKDFCVAEDDSCVEEEPCVCGQFQSLREIGGSIELRSCVSKRSETGDFVVLTDERRLDEQLMCAVSDHWLGSDGKGRHKLRSNHDHVVLHVMPMSVRS